MSQQKNLMQESIPQSSFSRSHQDTILRSSPKEQNIKPKFSASREMIQTPNRAVHLSHDTAVSKFGTTSNDIQNEEFKVKNLMESEIQQKNEQLRTLQQNFDQRTAELAMYKVTAEQEWNRQQTFKKRIQELAEENAKLQNQNESLKQERDQALLQLRQQVCFEIESSHLRSDKDKLNQILQQTTEFKSVAEAQDSENGRMRYLKNLHDHIQSTQSKKTCSKLCIDEKLLWVPEKAFHYCLEFKQRILRDQGFDIDEANLQLLLFELNKIWSQKIENDVGIARKNCEREVEQTKRRLKSVVCLSQTDKTVELERLRNRVRDLEKENRELFQKRSKRHPQGVQELIQDIKDKKVNKRITNKQNEKIGALETYIKKKMQPEVKQNEKFFMDGAAWGLKKITKTLQNLVTVNHISVQEALQCMENEITTTIRHL